MVHSLKRLIPRRYRNAAVEIPVIRLHGMIMDHPASSRSVISFRLVAPLLEEAFADKEAPVVAIVINSPGGSPVQSRLIFRRIRALAEEKDKKVLVFVEDVAASGGYMIACAGDEIFADSSSIVGSIGVVSSSFGFPELLKKLGVERRVHTAGRNKVTLDPFQPEKEEGVAHLKALQQEIHDGFINIVKARRASQLCDDPDLFTGLFWTGTKALDLGLIDAIDDIYAVVRQRYGKEATLRFIDPPKKGFLQRFLPSLQASSLDGLAENTLLVAQARALWQRFGL
ncbi:S49 family peptidase [Bartonella sp. DGB2]|uniref:S49 family peptidase n=1 Tax=Bartonella sp. DGB2 TaxID=3388426 RepID=UPI00398FFA3E